MSFFAYITANAGQIMTLLMDHMKLTAVAVGFAILIGVPLGIFISYSGKANKPILGTANVVQAIPSMALLGFMIPFLGIGVLPSVVAVILYSLLPIIKNTYTGIESINPQMVEAAKGIGLTPMQVLGKVQIPLALPVIMAGVRVASVTAVGLMTMAAFIGAGGLGYLVFSGIRTVNNNQILAGAIPACLLALLVDFLIGTVEKLVTPLSLQKGDTALKKKKRTLQKGIISVAAVVIAGVFLFTSMGNGPVTDKRIIEIGSKDFTEQIILGNMVGDLIEENTDIVVKKNLNLGGTQVCFSAMKTGDIDLYIDYSGTVYSDTLKHPPMSDMKQVYDTVKEEMKSLYQIEALKQMGFNNTYALGVTKETAEKYGLETISDFARVASTMKSGTTFEFLNREDGFPGVEKAYGFQMRESVAIDSSPRYTALIQGDVDVVDAFATDGLLKKFNLQVLKDDKKFFPPYVAIPLVRAETLKECPEIEPLLEKLGAVLTDDVMMELNYQVDELQQEPADVAHRFLKEQGLI